jgi:hypothetical protein
MNRCIRNRCIGFTKNNNKCRAITKDGSLFCSEVHKPLNNEILKDGCFICMEQIKNKNEILYFKCKHIFHKPCYNEWLNDFSTYDKPICMICRSNTFKKEENNIQKKNKKIKKITDISKLNDITNILYVKIPHIENSGVYIYTEWGTQVCDWDNITKLATLHYEDNIL